MASRGKQMRTLDEMIAKKREEIKKINIEIAALEEARQRTMGLNEQPRKRAARSDVKNLVLQLLEEAGSAGLVASVAVEMAEKRGARLERGTVSSLLSRLKHDKIVRYDGTAYRLEQFWNGGEPNHKAEATVHSFPTSKNAS